MSMADEYVASKTATQQPSMAEQYVQSKETQTLSMAEQHIVESPELDGSGVLETIAKHARPVIDRTIDDIKNELPYVPQDFAAGTVKGIGDLVDATKYLDPKHYLMDTSGAEQSGPAISHMGTEMANDAGTFPFFAGEFAGPLPTAQPLRTAKGAVDAVGLALKPANKLLSKATRPAVEKVTEMLTRESPVGTKADWLKTNFVQDYKLSDEFVDMIDTEVRQGKVQNDQAMQTINDLMSPLSSKERDIVQYLVTKDKVAFPDVAQQMENPSTQWKAAHRNLYTISNSLKNKIFQNQTELNIFGMLDDRHMQQRDLFGTPESAYVNRQYQNREALKGKLDPSKPGGRTIEGRRGLYDEQGNFVRSFTPGERATMKPETEYIAEKSIAKQLDDILQGRVMERTLQMKDTVMTPEQMKTFIGKTPKSEQNGYTLMQGQEYGNLSGHYVQTQTANRLKSMVDDVNREPSLWNNYRKYVGQWKAAVTIKNPKTHINNMMGNVGMMTTASDIPASSTAKIISNGLEIHNAGLEHTVYESARNIGLLERTKVQELAQMSGFDNSASKLATNDSKLMTAAKNAYLSQDSKMGKPVFDAYQKEDEVFKLGIYDHYLKEGMSPADARKATEKIVFDYAKKLPRGVEFLRDTGLIPFVTWSYRSLPMFADVLAKRPAQLGATAGALAALNGGDDDKLTQPTVGGSKLSSANWTPYMEYLHPQEYLKDQTLSGIPQQAAAIVSGNELKYGRMRTLDRKGTEPIDSLMGRAKAVKDLLPIPDVYNDLFDIYTDVRDGKRSPANSATHRLLFTNTPQKSSRNRKRQIRKRK